MYIIMYICMYIWKYKIYDSISWFVTWEFKILI